mgnify:CR=1 FL=1
MRHYIGLSENDLRLKRIDTPVFYEPSRLINSHLLVCGMSGTGKSFQSLEFLASAAHSGVEIDVFDPHDELDQIPGATSCMFSQATQYGFNPLILNTDPHTGGVNRQISFFVDLIKSVTAQFGIKQEGVLRNLLQDTYAAAGIEQNDMRSWHKRVINEQTRTMLIDNGQQDTLADYYPTLEDLKNFTRNKIIALTLGGDNECVTTFEQLKKLQKRLDNLNKKFAKEVDDDELSSLSEQIKAQKIKCEDTYKKFITSTETGRELDDVLKYDSVDVLTSVMQRLTLLSSTGILSANQAPFGNSRVRVHQIKSITHEQQVLYVKLKLQDIFEKCKRLGPTETGTELRHIVFLDEAHKFFTNEPDDIINIVAKEARKFGLGLWCASQQPTAFPESFLTNVGATILLGIHTSYWKRAGSMFRISEDSLKTVKPKEIMAVKLLLDGAVDPPFTNVVVPNPNNAMGRRAAAAAA